MGDDDIVFTIFTDSTDLYRSRLEELRGEQGDYTVVQAAKDHAGPLAHQGIDYFKELTYYEKKSIHNLKYFTWVEQQGKTTDDLNAQWDDEYWHRLFEDEVVVFDQMIDDFNQMVGSAG